MHSKAKCLTAEHPADISPDWERAMSMKRVSLLGMPLTNYPDRLDMGGDALERRAKHEKTCPRCEVIPVS